MNTFSNWESYARKLGLQTTKNSSKSCIWYDLEEFIVDGAYFASSDPRLFNSYLLFIQEIVNIAHPSKILKVIKYKSLRSKEIKVLGAVFEMALNQSKNKGQIKNFLSKLKNQIGNEEETLFSTGPWKPSEDFKKWGLLASEVDQKNIEKYLDMKKLLSNEHIKNRLLGVKAIYSDYLVLKCVYPEINPNAASKKIFWDYSQLHEVDKSISKINQPSI